VNAPFTPDQLQRLGVVFPKTEEREKTERNRIRPANNNKWPDPLERKEHVTLELQTLLITAGKVMEKNQGFFCRMADIQGNLPNWTHHQIIRRITRLRSHGYINASRKYGLALFAAKKGKEWLAKRGIKVRATRPHIVPTRLQLQALQIAEVLSKGSGKFVYADMKRLGGIESIERTKLGQRFFALESLGLMRTSKGRVCKRTYEITVLGRITLNNLAK